MLKEILLFAMVFAVTMTYADDDKPRLPEEADVSEPLEDESLETAESADPARGGGHGHGHHDYHHHNPHHNPHHNSHHKH